MFDTRTSGRRMLIGGEWVAGTDVIEVRDPEDSSLIDTVPAASPADVERTIAKAESGMKTARGMPAHQRASILSGAASLIEAQAERYAETLSRESSKTIREARMEVTRAVQTLRLSAQEATRLGGETIAFDQRPGSESRVGYYYRFPVGLVSAITPFNDPLNLVAHKVGPAIAAGNAVIVKPASLTPLSALLLAEALIEAGLPQGVLSVVTGNPRDMGDALITHPSIRMVSFTGGVATGEQIIRKAGIKKVSMELGSNSPVIVLRDADLQQAVEATVSGAFWAAGQNCLGVQRVFVDEPISQDFVDAVVQRTASYVVGSKRSELTDMGPMITEREAQRVEEWVLEATAGGAEILTGGKRDGSFYLPTVLWTAPRDSRIVREEVFGPVISIFPVRNLDEAIEQANDVEYGLQAGIFTNDLEQAFTAIHHLEVGGVMVNDSSDYRMDAMPFGGVKSSGIGREGVAFAVDEMTETKVVGFNLRSK